VLFLEIKMSDYFLLSTAGVLEHPAREEKKVFSLKRERKIEIKITSEY
jgi:hypothetical protein